MEDNIVRENPEEVIDARPRLRRFAIAAAGVGLSAAVAYLVSRALGALGALGEQREGAARGHLPDNIVDDQGTGQEKAAQILRRLRDRAFDASDEKLALALGRPVEEVTAWNEGMELIDDDVVMKARGIAMNRGVHIE